jgi:hypothetical protein|tara:strand:+ start:68 stop:640 length:573 start_codon:yes stop_codon:yes gene_type:complete
MKNNLKLINYFSIISLIFLINLNSCGIYKYSDARTNPTNANERVKKNIEEGRAFRLGDIGKKKSGGNFQFASSNPLWRASMEKLSFAPLNNVDYAGGIIVTDWFGSENQTNESIKITIRFLSNEIRSDALNVIIHKKICDDSNKCTIMMVKNNLNDEIKFAILKKASQFEKETDANKKANTKPARLPKNY